MTADARDWRALNRASWDERVAIHVFDDLARLPDGRPGYFAPYFARQPIAMVDERDYADPAARLANAANVNWLHPLSDTVGGLLAAGLTLDWLHEHAHVPWRMFEILVKKDDGDWHWPDKPWLPLAVSLQATRRQSKLKFRFRESKICCGHNALGDFGGRISDYAVTLSMSSNARR